MSYPYIGSIIPVAFTFAPPGYLVCDGQLLAISQYDVLFNLIGTAYGGDGVTSFALPNLQGRAAIGQGNASFGSFTEGMQGGQEAVTLSTPQLPVHTHGVNAQGAAGNSSSPINSYFAGSSDEQYASSPSAVTGPLLAAIGGSQSHANLQPYLVLNYIIAVDGVYPSRS